MRIIEEIQLSPLKGTKVHELKGTIITGIDNHGKTIELCAGIEHVKIGDPESGFPCNCGSVYCRLLPLHISRLKGDVLLTRIDQDESKFEIEEPRFFNIYATSAFLIQGKHWSQLAAQFPNLRPLHELTVVRRRDLIRAWWSEIGGPERDWKGAIENITIGNTWEVPQIEEAIRAVLQWGNEKPDEPIELHRVSELDVEVEQIWIGQYNVLCWEGFVRDASGKYHLQLNGLAPLPFFKLHR